MYAGNGKTDNVSLTSDIKKATVWNFDRVYETQL